MPKLDWVVSKLKRLHGAPAKAVSSDPFRLILYEQVAYLAPEAQRRAAFQRLEREIGLTAADILAAPIAKLRAITRAGGSIAAPLRAERIRKSADLVKRKWHGDLQTALALSLPRARRALTAFAMIGPPGADRILAIAGAHAVLGLDSNGLRVCLRLGWGTDRGAYAATYREVQEALAPDLPKKSTQLVIVSALLRRHGETICRRSTPDCASCPLAQRCEYASQVRGGGKSR